MHVRLSINEQGALRNQRYAFTDRYTLVSELLQNARRAKATRVWIDYDPATRQLVVEDDGFGISDFQKLFTLNESGWDESTARDERPFGVGFSKCLYSASRCIVQSLEAKIDFLTGDALSQRFLEVVCAEYCAGTRIVLFDVDLPDLNARIKDVCRGYSLPVMYDGEEVERPHAADTKTFLRSPIGAVHVAGIEDGRCTHDTAVYLQGICVLRPRLFLHGDRANVVHLDPSRFIARLPDRDKLIEEDEQRKLIEATVKELWRSILLERKQVLPAADFVDRYYDAARSWGQLDLFDDVPMLPKTLCRRIAGFPYQEGLSDQDYLKPMDRHISRDEVESGALRIVDIDSPRDKNLAQWMYARARGCLVKLQPLGARHWLNDHVRQLDQESTSVEIIGETSRTEFEGRWIRLPVVLCEKYAITVGGDRVEIDDEGLFSDPNVLIPMRESSGHVCRQVSSYVDANDRIREDERDADAAALSDLIRRLRAVDPQAAFESMIAELHLEKYPLLHGRTFHLMIGARHQEHSVELVG